VAPPSRHSEIGHNPETTTVDDWVALFSLPSALSKIGWFDRGRTSAYGLFTVLH